MRRLQRAIQLNIAIKVELRGVEASAGRLSRTRGSLATVYPKDLKLESHGVWHHLSRQSSKEWRSQHNESQKFRKLLSTLRTALARRLQRNHTTEEHYPSKAGSLE